MRLDMAVFCTRNWRPQQDDSGASGACMPANAPVSRSARRGLGAGSFGGGTSAIPGHPGRRHRQPRRLEANDFGPQRGRDYLPEGPEILAGRAYLHPLKPLSNVGKERHLQLRIDDIPIRPHRQRRDVGQTMRGTQAVCRSCPPLTDQQIFAQVHYGHRQGWAFNIEFTADSAIPATPSGEMWGLPMFDLRECRPGGLMELKNAARSMVTVTSDVGIRSAPLGVGSGCSFSVNRPRRSRLPA